MGAEGTNREGDKVGTFCEGVSLIITVGEREVGKKVDTVVISEGILLGCRLLKVRSVGSPVIAGVGIWDGIEVGKIIGSNDAFSKVGACVSVRVAFVDVTDGFNVDSVASIVGSSEISITITGFRVDVSEESSVVGSELEIIVGSIVGAIRDVVALVND